MDATYLPSYHYNYFLDGVHVATLQALLTIILAYLNNKRNNKRVMSIDYIANFNLNEIFEEGASQGCPLYLDL